MQAAILCVGRMKEKYTRAAADEYLKRLSRFGKVEEIEVPDLPEPGKVSPALEQQVMTREGERLLEKIKPGDYVIAMCIGGKQWSSTALANHLQDLQNQGRRRMVFVIGGSLGLSDQVIARADEKLSLSMMTFPHQLARVMLLEQLYRVCKINGNERYHK